MYKISDEAIKSCYKPYDVVTDGVGNVGIITEVDINECQPEGHQVSYSVDWLVIVKGHPHNAWWSHENLTSHCNVFVKIAQASCHPFGNNKKWVEKLCQ